MMKLETMSSVFDVRERERENEQERIARA